MDENTGLDGVVAEASETEDELEQKTEEEVTLEKYKDVIDRARAKFGDIGIFMAPKGFEEHGIFIVAAPQNPKLYDAYVNELADDKKDKSVASKGFANSCSVYPEREVRAAIFKKYPAFALKVAGRAQELAGSDVKELGKA